MNHIQDFAAPLMSETTRAPAVRNVARSVRAVSAGLLATFAVTTGVDLAFHALGVFPAFGERMSDALFVLALAYRIPLDTLGSALAARLAPARPMRHALVLGGIGVALATLGAFLMGDCGPAWYSLANIAIALPCAWCGGHVIQRRART